MMQHYPAKLDQIYGFECAMDFSNVDTLAPNVKRCISGTSAEKMGYRDVSEVVDSMTLFYNYVGLEDTSDTKPPTLGLSKFLKDVGVQMEDFVVMKMDVEGMQYGVIERMLEDGSSKLVDEVRACIPTYREVG